MSSYRLDDDDVELDGFSIADLMDDADASNSLLDSLHALKYGEPERGLGWAWNQAEEVAPATVRINCKPYTFDPLTRELREVMKLDKQDSLMFAKAILGDER